MYKPRRQSRRRISFSTTRQSKMNSNYHQSQGSSEGKFQVPRSRVEKQGSSNSVSEALFPTAGPSNVNSQVPTSCAQVKTPIQQSSEQGRQGPSETLSSSDRLIEKIIKMLQSYRVKMLYGETSELLDRIDKLEERVNDYKSFLTNLGLVLEERDCSPFW